MKIGRKAAVALVVIVAFMMLLVPLSQADIFTGRSTEQNESSNNTLPESSRTLDLKDGSITIYSDGYTQGQGKQTYVGAYEIISSADPTSNILVVEGGNHTIVFNDIEIDAKASSAVVIKAAMDAQENLTPANVNMILKGENILRSSSSYGQNAFAALYVGSETSVTNPDTVVTSSVTISAADSSAALYAYGGDGTRGGNPGAAAIGSNPNGVCGKIVINSGNVYAYGGDKGGLVSAGGSGAGIGNGGLSENSNNWIFRGMVEINGGKVYAEGGENAAGIGSGSSLGDSDGNEMVININGGIIEAIGGDNYGAGIGGEFSGIINIGGTANVTAVGGSRGGAGIGGTSGYPAGVSYTSSVENIITISGNAVVTSIGHKGAAGIGGGYGSGVLGTITISGNATIDAVSEGYSSGLSRSSGAAIGAGYLSFAMEAGGNIVIIDNAVVYAYTEGYGANAIGVGTPSSISDRADEANITTSISLGQEITLAAFVADASTAAVPQQDIPLKFIFSSSKYKEAPVVFNMDPDRLVYFTIADNEEYPEEDIEHDTTSSGSYKWEYNNSQHTLKVDETSFVWNPEYMESLGNWAVVIKVAPVSGYMVTYDANGASGNVPIGPNVYQEGESVTVLSPGNLERMGFIFKGWCDSATSTLYQPGNTFNMPDRNVTLTAIWEAESPVCMVFVIFCVNYQDYACVSVEAGSNLGDLMPNDPVSPGCEFVGWYLQDGSEFTSETVVNCNLVVYAKWQAVLAQ